MKVIWSLFSPCFLHLTEVICQQPSNNLGNKTHTHTHTHIFECVCLINEVCCLCVCERGWFSLFLILALCIKGSTWFNIITSMLSATFVVSMCEFNLLHLRIIARNWRRTTAVKTFSLKNKIKRNANLLILCN